MNPVEMNVEGVATLVKSKLNKVAGGYSNDEEGVDIDQEDVLTLKLDDSELIALAKKWAAKYGPYEYKIKLRQQENKKYYEGRQREGTSIASDGRPIAANLIFEAVETFLAAALARNPDPVVYGDNSEPTNTIAGAVKTMLQFHADVLCFRQKLQLLVRKWCVDFLGVLKFGWDAKTNDISVEIRDVKDFIFDPDGYVDTSGHFVGYLGERITVSAKKLVDMFPKHKAYITLMVDGKMGTDATYTEWWNDDYTFCTFEGKVLDKSKNPNFNYNTTKLTPDMNEDMIEMDVIGHNHFAFPQSPYVFLSVFSFGKQPHDETGLIEQNIPNQRRITRRTEQIDYNLQNQNNSTVFSEANFNQETAKQAARAKAQGNPILIPQGGPAQNAIIQLDMKGVDSSFFDELENSKNDLRSVFGTQGITAQQGDEDTTARGMILNQQYDNSRIGGGIGDKLETVAKASFNWLVQLYYVFYDEHHFASVMGQMKAVEFITLDSNAMSNSRLVVSVASDSMKPHDEITEMNQAMSLWSAKAIDIKTLLTRLNFPDPQETAAQAWLYQTNPQMYGMLNFPELTQQIQQLMAAQAPPPQPGAGVPVPGSPPPSTAGVPASPALSQVPLPK